MPGFPAKHGHFKITCILVCTKEQRDASPTASRTISSTGWKQKPKLLNPKHFNVRLCSTIECDLNLLTLLPASSAVFSDYTLSHKLEKQSAGKRWWMSTWLCPAWNKKCLVCKCCACLSLFQDQRFKISSKYTYFHL